MRTPREPFSWDGDDEPVSLESLGSSGPKIVDEAEIVVSEAQEAIGREDTDPSITLPEAPKAASRVGGLVAAVMDRSISRRGLVAGLAAICLFAFAHGWSLGSATAKAASSACVLDHCSLRSASHEWKEEQRP